MKKILILGRFGFIGTNITKYIYSHYGNEYSVVIFGKSTFPRYGITSEFIEKSY